MFKIWIYDFPNWHFFGIKTKSTMEGFWIGNRYLKEKDSGLSILTSCSYGVGNASVWGPTTASHGGTKMEK